MVRRSRRSPRLARPTAPLAWLAVSLAAGCATSAPPVAREPVLPEDTPAAVEQRPEIVALTEEELFIAGLDGCQVSATPDDPVVAYCPEAVFGVKAVRETGADVLFNEWLEEVRAATGAQITVVERHQEKLFGPQVTALRLILRHPRAALEATNLVYVALVDVKGERRRVWCSAPSHEPAGIARCQQGLLSAAHARLR